MPRFDGCNRCIEFDYVDADGVVTRRMVNVDTFYRPAHEPFWYVAGFCHLRRENRTFRSDRIHALYDKRAGLSKVWDPSAWVESLWLASSEGHHEAERRQRREEREQEAERYLAEQEERWKMDEEAQSIINQHFHALRALLYVAKADKAFRAMEKRLFLFFFKRVAGHRMDTYELEARCLKAAMSLDTPTTGQFHYSVRKLVSGVREYRMAVCATAKAMINSDKKVAAYELEVLGYLTRKLRPLED